MKVAFVLGILLAVALVGHTTAALGPGLSTREQNRQILISEEQGGYDPDAIVAVTQGAPAYATTSTMTAAEALEDQLDFLDRHNIDLSQYLTVTASNPAWPLVGEIEMHERGWNQEGADCPVIQPEAQAVRDAYHALIGNLDVGFFESGISESWRTVDPVTGVVREQTSTLKFAATPQGEQATFRYGGIIDEGWTILAGFLITDDDEDADFFCKEPEDDSVGVAQLDAVILPLADRTDD